MSFFNFGTNIEKVKVEHEFEDASTETYAPFGITPEKKEIFNQIIPGKSIIEFTKEDSAHYSYALVTSKNDTNFTLTATTLKKDDSGNVIGKINHPYISAKDISLAPRLSTEEELKEFE